MKMRKTPTNQRTNYIYEFSDGTKTVIRPEDFEGAELWINQLHKADDSEVYRNLKEAHPYLTKEQKAEIKAWEDAHPGEEAPSKWNVSIEAMTTGESGDDCSDKCVELGVYDVDYDELGISERMQELLDGMPPKRRQALLLVKFEGYTVSEAALIMETTPANISIHIKKAVEYIKSNF